MSPKPRSPVTFDDGFTVSVGDTVRYRTRHGGHGSGTVTGFGRSMGCTTVRVEPDADAVYGMYDRWALKDGGDFNLVRDHGVSGGGILRPDEFHCPQTTSPSVGGA